MFTIYDHGGIFSVAMLLQKYIYTNISQMLPPPSQYWWSVDILLILSLSCRVLYTTKPNLNGESPGFIFLYQADGSSFSIIQRVRRNVSICLQMVQLWPDRGHRFQHLQCLLKMLWNLKLLIYIGYTFFL